MIKNTKNLTKALITHPLFSGSALMIGGSLGINAINYVYHLLMGRLLGPEGYGVLASLFSILYIISIVPMSSSFAIVKFISSAKDAKERTAIYLAIKKLLWKIGGAGFIVTILLSPAIADFLHIPEKLSVFLIGPIIFFSLITLVNQASMQGILRFIGLVGPNLASAVAKLVLGVSFVLLGLSVTGAVGGILLAAALAYLLSVRLKGDLFSQKTSRKFEITPFLKYALPVLLQALAFTSFITIDVVLVKHFLPPFEAGLYAAISTLGKIVYFAAQPITATMFPIVAGKRAKGERYKNIFYAAFFLTVFMSVGIVLFYYFFPKIAIGLLYGEKYLSASAELVWIGAFMAVYTASYILVNFLLSINRTKIVVLPLLAAIAQAVGIIFWHGSILQVIQVSLVATLALFAGLSLYLGHYQFRKIYAKR